jgi:hypothetical protein
MKSLVGALAAAAAVCFTAQPVAAQSKTVSVTVPVAVGFLVTNVAVGSVGSPSTTRISFSNVAGFQKSDRFNVSVRADSATFAGPGTTRIPASKVTWTASASRGTATNGTLSSTAYSQVYISPANTSSGSVDLQWSLGAITAAGLRAGTHTLTVRWRVEAL